MKYFSKLLEKRTTDDEIEIYNLLRSVRVDQILNDKYLIDYTIKDGDSPEQIAHNVYGNIDLWWIPLVVNNIKDRFYEFPMNDRVLRDYYTYLVGLGETPTYSDMVTENNAKRNIKIIDPKFISGFLYQIEEKINEG